MFVARIKGRLMEPRIPAGSYCLFRGNPDGGPIAGSRQGKIVLAALRDAADPEDGGAHTVKVYRRVAQAHVGNDASPRVHLESLNAVFAPIELPPDEDVVVAAEFVRVI